MVIDKTKKISAYFYKLDSGKEPVREWLLSLDRNDRQIIGKDIQKIEFGWPLGMPFSRNLEKGLYESPQQYLKWTHCAGFVLYPKK